MNGDTSAQPAFRVGVGSPVGGDRRKVQSAFSRACRSLEPGHFIAEDLAPAHEVAAQAKRFANLASYLNRAHPDRRYVMRSEPTEVRIYRTQ